jgi:tetratricopeptide (TPR) repeat protein
MDDTSVVHNYRGLMLLELDRHGEAVAEYDRALELDPGYFEATHDRALCFERMGDRRGALEGYARAIALRPESAHPRLSRARLLHEMGDLAGAVADWSEALEIDSANADVSLRCGFALLSLGRLDEAYRRFTRAVELDATCADAYWGRAEVWRRRGSRPDMRRNLEAALAAAPRRWPRRRSVECELRGR